MSWLRNSTFGASIGKLKNLSASNKEFDPSACYDSFRKHWQQINETIQATQKKSENQTKKDDVLAVIYNLDHMVTLLLLEFSSQSNLKCLDFILNEQILDQLYRWSRTTGRFENALKCEQLKLYEVLVSYSATELLIHDNFYHSLLKLLTSCLGGCFEVEIEKRLVVLLNNLCVAFIHDNELLYLFFENSSSSSPKFIIFSLLVPYVHREGTLGQQTRDALLHCMKLSKHNQQVAEFIALHSNICPVLATGLSGLYSLLPRILSTESQDWHRITPDDINEFPELATFMNSLEFCNAAIEVAHPLVVAHLLEFIYQGFLVPVMGPALLQDCSAERLNSSSLVESAIKELTTATAYFDMFIRSLTAPGLIYCFIKFILTEEYDGQCIIDIFVERIGYNSKLCLVTIALMETLVDLNCEDIMMELVFKHLISCNHVMASQRFKLHYTDPYCKNAEMFLQLVPNIQRSRGYEGSLYGDYHAYLSDAKMKIELCAIATSVWTYSYNGENPPTIGTRLNVNENDTDYQSLPSTDDVSSGYESFARIGEASSECGSGGEFDSPSSESEISSDGKPNVTTQTVVTTPKIGPFLQSVFNKLENMLSQNLFVNLHLTGLISRLAVFSQPLLSSFLLDHSLVFQPSIRSLFQIISSLKQQIESKLSDYSNSQLSNLVAECEAMLLDRENKLINFRKYALQALSNSITNSDEPCSLGVDNDRDCRKKGFTFNLNSVFRRQHFHQTKSDQKLEELKSGYRYIIKDDGIHNVVMCALLLTEWLKELAAICQEHSVFRLHHCSVEEQS